MVGLMEVRKYIKLDWGLLVDCLNEGPFGIILDSKFEDAVGEDLIAVDGYTFAGYDPESGCLIVEASGWVPAPEGEVV